MARGAAESTLPWSPGTWEGLPLLSSLLPGSMVGCLLCTPDHTPLMTGSSPCRDQPEETRHAPLHIQ